MFEVSSQGIFKGRNEPPLRFVLIFYSLSLLLLLCLLSVYNYLQTCCWFLFIKALVLRQYVLQTFYIKHSSFIDLRNCGGIVKAL